MVLESYETHLTLFEALNASVAFLAEDRRFILYPSDLDPADPSSALPLLTFDGNELTGDPTLVELAQHALAVLNEALKQRNGG